MNAQNTNQWKQTKLLLWLHQAWRGLSLTWDPFRPDVWYFELHKTSTNEKCVHYWWSNYSIEKNKVQLWTKRKKHEWFKYVNVAWGYLRMLRAPFLWCLVQMCQQGNLFVPLFLTSLFWYLSSTIFPFYHPDICGIYLCCQGYLFVPLYFGHIFHFLPLIFVQHDIYFNVQFPLW